MGESCSRCLNYNDKNNSDATHITTQEINTRGGPRELLAFLIFGYKKHFPKQAPILFFNSLLPRDQELYIFGQGRSYLGRKPVYMWEIFCIMTMIS